MNLSMDILAERLSAYQIEQVYGAKARPVLESVRLLHRHIASMDRKYLYMGIPEDIGRVNADSDGITIICSGETEDYQNISPNCNLYFIRNDVDFGKFFNEVEDVFTYYNNWTAKLSALGSTMANLQQFIDASDEIIQYPLALVDYGESTIAYSKHKDSDDLVWQYIRQGHINTEYLLRDNIHSCDIARYTKPVQLFTTASDRYILIQPVIVYQHTVAFVVAMMTHPGEERFSSATEQLLANLTQAVTSRMCADEYYGLSMGMASEFFLADLISRKITDPSVIMDRARFINQPLLLKRRILCVEGGTELDQKAIRTIRERGQELMPGIDCCTYQSSVIFIEKIFDETVLPEEKYKEFTSWIKQESLACGVSSPFSSLMQMADYYEQAKTAIRFGAILEPEKKFFYYSDYTMLHEIEMLDKQIDIRTLIHPLLYCLFDLYGEDHAMVETLRVYLSCERNVTNAAKQLYVHRNSMLYRVEQLTQKLHCDFADPIDRLQLLHSFEIIDYLKKIKGERVCQLTAEEAAEDNG